MLRTTPHTATHTAPRHHDGAGGAENTARVAVPYTTGAALYVVHTAHTTTTTPRSTTTMAPAELLNLQTEIFDFAFTMIKLAFAAPILIGALFTLAIAFGGDRI